MKIGYILNRILFGALCAFAGFEMAFLVGKVSHFYNKYFLWGLSFVVSMILLFKYYNKWDAFWKKREKEKLKKKNGKKKA